MSEFSWGHPVCLILVQTKHFLPSIAPRVISLLCCQRRYLLLLVVRRLCQQLRAVTSFFFSSTSRQGAAVLLKNTWGSAPKNKSYDRQFDTIRISFVIQHQHFEYMAFCPVKNKGWYPTDFLPIYWKQQNNWCPAEKYLELVEKYLESGSNNDATFLANCRSRSRLQGPISVSMVSEWRCFRANFQLYLWTTFTCICGQLSIVYVNNFHLYLWTTFTCFFVKSSCYVCLQDSD